MILPTVTIFADNARGRRIINEADFDPDTHELWTDGGGGLPTPDDIDKMKRAEVAEWLEAHGAQATGKIADMRAALKRVMFIGLD